MNKFVLFVIVFVLIASALWFTRFTYLTAYLCIYKIDNWTTNVYLSCQSEPWEVIKKPMTASEYLDSKNDINGNYKDLLRKSLNENN